MTYLKVTEKLGFFSLPHCVQENKIGHQQSSATGAIRENSAKYLILAPSAQIHKV